MIQITAFGRNIIKITDHIIMSVDLSKMATVDVSLNAEKINNDNLKICDRGVFQVRFMENYIKRQAEKFDGFLFYCGNEPVGYMWIAYKGANEAQYKIRNIDAYICDVCIFPEFRGKGYCAQMFSHCRGYLMEKGIEKVYLACRPDNTSALRAYDKLGFKTEYEKKLVRILRMNIPYIQL